MTRVTITDAMVDACYSNPERVPEVAKRRMRQAIERALIAGGHEVLHQHTADWTPTVAEIHELQAYADWAWKMSRATGLDASVFDKANTRLYKSNKEGSLAPPAVFINNISTEREFDLLYNWARRTFGSIDVGGGQRPDHTWWVRITPAKMSQQGFDYPTARQKEDQ